MTLRPTLLASLAGAALVAGCAGPCVVLPGGSLPGATAATPESWAFTDEVDTIQFETNPADPYSVNIWVIALGDHLYVHAGANRATWVENMEADPNVRLQVKDQVYELAAARVEDQSEFDRFSDAYEKKYGRRPRNENVAEAYLFRLSAR
ncbi:MAG: nitroreductase/quinone reductase family protein [Myxococcota bacterium]|nr:nitroreductase/quinone reductase family protein [Myxococcota bacterium]